MTRFNKTTKVTDISGGRGRFDSCETVGDMIDKLRSNETLKLYHYGSREQLEVRRPHDSQWSTGRGIVATAKIG